jgi:ABC-type nitrate/sulfonate/bicarbonate transport system permease component
VSGARILAGWSAGVVVGVAVGGVMASIRWIRYLLDPLIEITRPLPPLAFIPLFIVWFGIGETPKFTLILVGVVPIMIIATVSALDSVPKELVQARRSLGASPLWALATVRLRSALPPIITGMRPDHGRRLDQHRAVELIAATSGLGYLINNAGVNLQTRLVLSGILAISVLAIAFDGLLRLLHRLGAAVNWPPTLVRSRRHAERMPRRACPCLPTDPECCIPPYPTDRDAVDLLLESPVVRAQGLDFGCITSWVDVDAGFVVSAWYRKIGHAVGSRTGELVGNFGRNYSVSRALYQQDWDVQVVHSSCIEGTYG